MGNTTSDINPLFTSIYINLFDHDTFPLKFVNNTNLFSNSPLQIVLFFHLCLGNCKMQRGSCKFTPNARTFSYIIVTTIYKLWCYTCHYGIGLNYWTLVICGGDQDTFCIGKCKKRSQVDTNNPMELWKTWNTSF